MLAVSVLETSERTESGLKCPNSQECMQEPLNQLSTSEQVIGTEQMYI